MQHNSHPLQQISFTEPNQAYVIEASAGTGKTWTIERLYIKALLEATNPDNQQILLSIENILVVTFTNDATDELKQRISEQIQVTINQIIYLHRQLEEYNKPETNSDIFLNYLLQRQADGFDFRKDLTLLTRALQNFDQAAIYTIHGFCNRILQDYQFECQTPANFELLASKSQVINELVRDFMRSQIINNSELQANLEIVMSNLEQLFSSNNFQLSLIERITAKLPQDLFKINAGNYQVKYNLHAVSNLSLLGEAELSDDLQRQAKAEFIAALVEYINQHYATVCERLNALSYDELIQKVADSVINSDSLTNKIFTQFPLAFIDEFQDTDSLQWQIFSTVYQLTSQKRGYVVVVGDPKQAIYRFRGADVDTYLEAREQIGQRLELASNYRSHPNIMNFINQLFDLKNQMPNLADDSVDIKNSFLGNLIDYTKVEACGKSKLTLPTANELTKLTEAHGISLPFYDQEVQLVAITGSTSGERSKKLLSAMTLEILALLKADPELKGKIAILVTKNREASEIVAFLRKFGVKAAELKLGNIFATTTAHDFYLILDAIADLANKKLLLQALTSTLFNLDLTKLVGGNEQQNQTLEFWHKKFFTYQAIWERQGIFSVVYALLQDIITTHQDNQAVLSNRELANLWQLAELLNKQAHRLHNHHELLHWLKTKISNAETQLSADLDGSNEELVRLDNDDEQIIITTQHKSKGLEYEILFCPYFKSGIQLDGMYDFNYRRPFFSTFRNEQQECAELVMDVEQGQRIVANDNTEAHRLNYVALTRAKSRIYIYLKQPTLTKAGKYNSMQRPDKLVELFGYKANDPFDNSHLLFNYAQFFGEFPESALKVSQNPHAFAGVVAYQRPALDLDELNNLRLEPNSLEQQKIKFNYSHSKLHLAPSFIRQSYSGLTSHDSDSSMLSDYFVKNEAPIEAKPEYRYSILHDSNFKGAVFGTLFHSLCEEYPFSDAQLKTLLIKANLNIQDNDYTQQLKQMVDEAFNYPLIDKCSINDFVSKQHELDFNLTIVNEVSFREQLAVLIADYFGAEHPFSHACKQLDKIEVGFLVGFIDLFFEHQGKYWVLDYKTNSLTNYQSPTDCTDMDNSLIDSMADHHYYLQYLLYLVAIKRYLEQRLDVEDGSELIGGSVYYYVRGIYTSNCQHNDGIYIDRGCQDLVRKLDQLLSGVNNVK